MVVKKTGKDGRTILLVGSQPSGPVVSAPPSSGNKVPPKNNKVPPKKRGPRTSAPGEKVGKDCKYLTVKLPKGEQIKLLAWVRGRGMTMRGMFEKALRELMADPPDDMQRMEAIHEQDQVSVLVPLDLWQEVTKFSKNNETNKQTIMTLAIERFQEKNP